MEKSLFTKDRMLRYGKNTVMGIQHLFAMMGATILVPMLCNMSIAVGLIAAGVGTIIFFFITKKKVPVFLGSSFAFMGALAAQMNPQNADGVYLASIDPAWAIGGEAWNVAMAQQCIAVFCTGAVYVIIAAIIKMIGTGFIRKLFPPVVVGPVIIVIGLCLSDAAINNMAAPAGSSATVTAGYIVTAILTAATIIGVSVFAKGFVKVIPVLLGIVVGYICALCFGIIDFTPVKEAGWIIFQPSEFTKSFGFWGDMFTAEVWNRNLVGVIFAFVPIAIVTFMEHLGDVNASSIVCGKDFVRDPGVHRTLTGDGVATMAAGLLGGPCNTTYGENTAVLAITKNYNPYLLALAAIFAIVLGIFTKFGAIIATIPAPVIGGASLILYGMIAANGLKTMVEAKIDFSDSKNMIICSLILVIGIGLKVTGHTLDIGVVSFSPLAVATFVGIIVNALFLITNKKQPSGLSGTYGGELVADGETPAEADEDEPAAGADTAENSDETSETAADTATESGADKPDV